MSPLFDVGLVALQTAASGEVEVSGRTSIPSGSLGCASLQPPRLGIPRYGRKEF